jgi:hypothetical protein
VKGGRHLSILNKKAEEQRGDDDAVDAGLFLLFSLSFFVERATQIAESRELGAS